MFINGLSLGNNPEILYILVNSKASFNSNGGKIEGKHFAIRVFPDPGEPHIKILWFPAAAISKAFLAFSWPFTYLKSYSYSVFKFSFRYSLISTDVSLIGVSVK